MIDDAINKIINRFSFDKVNAIKVILRGQPSEETVDDMKAECRTILKQAWESDTPVRAAWGFKAWRHENELSLIFEFGMLESEKI